MLQIFYSTKFAKEYKKIPTSVKRAAEKKEKLFRKDLNSPSLKTHKLTGKLKVYSAFSIDYHYRIIFELKEKDVIWFHSVGTHSIYAN